MEQPRLLRGMHRHVEVEQQQRHDMWCCRKRPAQHELLGVVKEWNVRALLTCYSSSKESRTTQRWTLEASHGAWLVRPGGIFFGVASHAHRMPIVWFR